MADYATYEYVDERSEAHHKGNRPIQIPRRNCQDRPRREKAPGVRDGGLSREDGTQAN